MNEIINKPANCICEINGENNKVIFGLNQRYYEQTQIYIGSKDCKTNNCTIKIGNNLQSNGFYLRVMENNTIVTIGDDCLFSSGIRLWASDTHTIFDNTGKIINIGKFIHIGNHVWLCENSTILKNSIISDNSIVGNSAVLSGKFLIPGSILAGNPAKCIKTGINWNDARINNLIY